MRYAKFGILVLCILTVVAALYGCGSSSKEGTASGTGDSVARVSETACITCHSTSLERLTGDPIVEKYIASIHNLNSVGCQDCHGGGANHNGVGPIPYPSPNYVQCQKCHDAKKLVTKYAASKHLGVAIENEADEPCQRCHTHQGAVLAAKFGFTGDGEVMAAMVNAPGLITDPEPIKCNTCHVTHDTKTLRVDAGWNPPVTVGSVTASTNAQYRLCTQCHGLVNPAGMLMGSGTSTSGTALVGHHETSWFRIIGTTHYDDPATAGVEGYNLRWNSSDPCFDCHGHEAKANTGNLTRNAAGKYVLDTTVERTILTDWAKSGHGGGILTAKYDAQDAYPKKSDGTYDRSTGMTDAVMAAGADSSWNADPWNSSGEADCQRCHTATGAKNYLSSQSTYTSSLNDYSHLYDWNAVDGSTQTEVLYCWACHSNTGDGTLRTPGAYKTTSAETLSYYSFEGASITFPDVSSSNVCIPCHAGRRNREYIATGTRSSSPRAHHLSAAGTLFSEKSHMLYEYDLDGDGNFAEHYLNQSYFAHDKIGTAAEPGTGSNGPCVACHMGGASHTFSVVTESGSAITAITNQALCDVCHTSAHGLMTPAKLEEESAGALEAQAVLRALVTGTGNYTGAVISTSTPTLNDYGALQSSRYMDDGYDVGAYAHNSYYIKRIIFDSIDWLDNATFDGTILIDATTYPEAAVWYGAPLSTSGTYTATRPARH